MADNEHQSQNNVVEALFEAGRRGTPALSEDFLARLEADMDAQLPSAKPSSARSDWGMTFSWWPRLFAASGLAGAALAGVWIGFAMPETFNALAGSYVAAEAYGIEAFLPQTAFGALSD